MSAWRVLGAVAMFVVGVVVGIDRERSRRGRSAAWWAEQERRDREFGRQAEHMTGGSAPEGVTSAYRASRGR